MFLNSIFPQCGIQQSFKDNLPLPSYSTIFITPKPIAEQMERFAFRPHTHIDRILETMQMQAERAKEVGTSPRNSQCTGTHRTNSGGIQYRAGSQHKISADNLRNLFGVKDRPATARLVLRVRPMKQNSIEFDDGAAAAETVESGQRPWVTLDYSFNRANSEEVFKVFGTMDDLLPEEARGELRGWGGLFEKDIQLRIFFKNIDYMINNLEGRVFWNGFIIDLAGPSSSRLELLDLEMDPLRLIFSVTRIKELIFVRGKKRYEVHGNSLGKGASRQFKIRGLGSDQIKESYPRDGTVVINFPPYFACMDDA